MQNLRYNCFPESARPVHYPMWLSCAPEAEGSARIARALSHNIHFDGTFVFMRLHL